VGGRIARHLRLRLVPGAEKHLDRHHAIAVESPEPGVRKIATHRYYPKSSRENSEEGLVVALVTIARDGRLLDVAISRSSGYKALDSAVLEVIRQAAPYAPLPNDVLGDRHTFVLPLNYRRNDQ
jgi:TonB family protein